MAKQSGLGGALYLSGYDVSGDIHGSIHILTSHLRT